jgi:hypothetical protein
VGLDRTAFVRVAGTIFVVLAVLGAISNGGTGEAHEAGEGDAHVAEISGYLPFEDGSFLLVNVLVDTHLAAPDAALQALLPGARTDDEPGQVTGAFLRWIVWAPEAIPLTVRYNGVGAPIGIDAAGIVAETTGAWNAAPGHTWRFNYAGATQATTDVCDNTGDSDGEVTIGWRNDLPIGILARTCAYVRPSSGGNQARAMDVAFSSSVPWSTAAATEIGKYDLQSTMLHELGHVLGLDHSNVSGAIMLPQIGSGQQRRELSADDIAGIQALYPAPILPANALFLPVLGRD